jgi:hypothetical protein
MTILKADILTRVNERLQTAETDIDVEIQETLDDLSEHDLLVASDSSQSLVSGGETLDHPTGYRSMIALTLTLTASGSEQFPLQKLKGGHREYRNHRHNDDSLGIPRWYSDFNGKFYLWRNANAAMTALIEYYKDHPQDVANIEFDDMYKNVIYAGATYRVALEKGRTRMIETWRPIYLNALQKRIAAMDYQPRIVRG